MCSNERDDALRSPPRSRTTEGLCQAYRQLGDFQYAPFSQQGSLSKAYELFGDGLGTIPEELNGALME